MFAIDIETLSHKENAVILSCALTYFTTEKQYSFNDLIKNSCFVKFNAKEQITKYKRSVSKSTIEWWKKQNQIAKEISLKPYKTDLPLLEGITKLVKFKEKFSVGKEIIFCRGSLDQFCMQDVFEQLNIPQLFEYYQYRDFRTAIECLKDNSEKGFCHVPNLDMNKVIPHHPVHDNCRDIMMLLS